MYTAEQARRAGDILACAEALKALEKQAKQVRTNHCLLVACKSCGAGTIHRPYGRLCLECGHLHDEDGSPLGEACRSCEGSGGGPMGACTHCDGEGVAA